MGTEAVRYIDIAVAFRAALLFGRYVPEQYQ